MGKFSFQYTDSEETEDAGSSIENLKKKKRFSILKYTSGNVRKKKCRVHSVSDPDDEFKTKSLSKMHKKLRGILKHERESSDEDEDTEPVIPLPKEKYLVGSVPRTAGSRPGRGGGVAFVIRKNTGGIPILQSYQEQPSTTKRRSMKRLYRKKSF